MPMWWWLAGWTCGWVLAFSGPKRARPSTAKRQRSSISVVIPARNEAHNIKECVESAMSQTTGALGVEVIVVDDSSSDATVEAAAAAGTRVVAAGPLPNRWHGKPHSLGVGTRATSYELLAFVDADVRLAPGSLARLGELAADGVLVSVQPWHAAGATWEQLSIVPNVLATLALRFPGQRTFGPVLVTTRTSLDRAGGWESVADHIIEDVAIGRRYVSRRVLAGRRWATFRMHDSPRSMLDGWSRVLGPGMSTVPLLALAGSVLWMAALVGGPVANPWLYLANVGQLAVVGRRAGRFHFGAVLYPLSVTVVLIATASALLRRPVQWKGRRFARRA